MPGRPVYQFNKGSSRSLQLPDLHAMRDSSRSLRRNEPQSGSIISNPRYAAENGLNFLLVLGGMRLGFMTLHEPLLFLFQHAIDFVTYFQKLFRIMFDGSLLTKFPPLVSGLTLHSAPPLNNRANELAELTN